MRALIRERKRDRGVAAVEMALMAPLLVALFIGAVEVSWLLAQSLDVRQAAREAGRLAAIDYGDVPTIGAEACNAMDNADDTTIDFSGSGVALGQDITIRVTKTASHLTSFLNWAFPPGMTISSASTFSLEVSPPSWADGTHSC